MLNQYTYNNIDAITNIYYINNKDKKLNKSTCTKKLKY